MNPRIVYLYGRAGLYEPVLAQLRQEGCTILRGTNDRTNAEFLQRAQDAQVIVMDDHEFKDDWFEQLPALKLVVRRGVGYDKIPVEVATQHHVLVANTPGANAISVAEIAVGLMMETTRKMVAARQFMTQFSGRMYPSSLLSHTLSSRTIGLVGYGHIAQATEKLLSGFGASILVTARHAHRPRYGQFVSLPVLLAQSDIVSLHLPATAETRHLFDRHVFAQMKSDAILINTSRGALVDELDLVTAVETGMIGGAGLDTTRTEPVPATSPLLDHERIIVLPHVGGFTVEAEIRTAQLVADNILDLFQGKRPRFAVN